MIFWNKAFNRPMFVAHTKTNQQLHRIMITRNIVDFGMDTGYTNNHKHAFFIFARSCASTLLAFPPPFLHTRCDMSFSSPHTGTSGPPSSSPFSSSTVLTDVTPAQKAAMANIAAGLLDPVHTPRDSSSKQKRYVMLQVRSIQTLNLD
jgi:hypothetical protein